MNRSATIRIQHVLAVVPFFVVLSVSACQADRDSLASEQLSEAVAQGEFQRVAELLQKGGDVNAVRPPMPEGTDFGWEQSHSMLSLAIRLRHPDVARLLLRYGADPNGDQPGNARQPLFWAAYTHDEKIFDALVEAGADLEFSLNGSTAYQHASGKYDNVANFLRERGALTEEGRLDEPPSAN